MRERADEIRKEGAELVIVGNGQPQMAAAFKKRLKLATPLYVDPKMDSYKAAGLKRTKLGTIGPRVWLPALKALLTGHMQRGEQGDPYQQGGVYIILPGDKVIYSHISKRASDRPKVSAVLKALKKERGQQ